MKRSNCLSVIAEMVSPDVLAVVALGKNTDLWNALRPSSNNYFNSGMGANLGVSMGLALALPHRKVVLLDTDGSQLMGLYSLATVANYSPNNLTVFVMDNESYAYTGGQRTATAGRTDLSAMARSAGIELAYSATESAEFYQLADQALKADDFSYIVAKVEATDDMEGVRGFSRREATTKFIRQVEAEEGVKIVAHH